MHLDRPTRFQFVAAPGVIASLSLLRLLEPEAGATASRLSRLRPPQVRGSGSLASNAESAQAVVRQLVDRRAMMPSARQR
jgi:hypothetical protein